MKRLAVYLNNQRAGTLEQNNSGLLSFSYAPDFLDSAGAIPLSRMLPLQREPFKGKLARSFFAGVLPDEGPRRQIAAVLGISESNDFAMLERIGGECAGAVSLLAEDAAVPSHESRLRELSEGELQAIVAELPHRPLLAGEEGVRLSLAGSQDKLPVCFQGSTVFLPLGQTPSTHILKPEPQRFPGLAAVEALCMTLARASGLTVPQVIVRQIGERPCILVERYDRAVGNDGHITRLHQEDFCQAMGFPPERKYQQEGGPLLRDCIAMLRDWSTTPVLDIRELVDGLIYNVLIGNADAHGKNYSLIYNEGRRRLAPFYDLVCTLVWPELSRTPAMKIGQSDSIDAVTPAHWQKMAVECHLGWPLVRRRITERCQRTTAALEDPAVQGLIQQSDIAGSVVEIIGQQTSRLLERLR